MNYNTLSLKDFRALFATLPIPDAALILGKFRAAFVGPAWLRTSAAPALAITGLGGWWGKEFHDDGTILNIVLRTGKFSTRFPIGYVKTKSLIDHKDGLALHHQLGNPFRGCTLWMKSAAWTKTLSSA